jgi:branched-chain amino acid transport system ATP-binding protein
MLKIRNLHAYYGPVEALSNVSLTIEEGKITCLIGANGAGKTTLLKAISGVISRTGSIEMKDLGELIDKKPSYMARHGIIHVPEGRHVFPGLSVHTNLESGAIAWRGFWGKKSCKEDFEEVYDFFPRLKERQNQLAWSLSGGEQQMLAIGRAMMARPKVLMLDEPSMGLAPIIVEINARGLPILLVEQNARLALEVSDNAYIIEGGRIRLSGKSSDLKADPRVVQAYLGKHAVL